MLIPIKINNINLLIKKQFTILELSKLLNQSLPRFCYHKQLNIVGNCRMCLVELKNSIKPIIACATNILPNMEILTSTPLIYKARENILEFLLINHPLDCPICDQASECDLQDQVYYFGSDKSRFYDYKRSVENKKINMIVSSIMTRCIHCTRCIRFISEIISNNHLILLNRGLKMEVGYYLNVSSYLNLSGNLVDLCPVGALISTPYKSISRVWDLKLYNTFDIFEIYTSFIKIELKNSQIFRILPTLASLNFIKNNSWITDKTRFSFESLIYQRIEFPIIKTKKVTWEISFIYIKNLLNSYYINNIALICGSFIDIETLILAKKFLNSLGSSNLYNLYNYKKVFPLSLMYYISTFIYHKIKSFCIILNFDLNQNLLLINIKLKKYILLGSLHILYFGSKCLINYPYYYIGITFKYFLSLLDGGIYLSKFLTKKKKIFVLYTDNTFNIIKNLLNYSKLLNFINISFIFISNYISQINSIDLGFTPGVFSNLHKKQLFSKIKLIYLLGVHFFKKKKKSIYQGHNFTQTAQYSNIILPVSNTFEKKTSYLNIFGSLILTKIILIKNKLIKDDWQILFFLINFLKLCKDYKLVNYINYKKKLLAINFKVICIYKNLVTYLHYTKIYQTPIQFLFKNLYITDTIFNLSPIFSGLEKKRTSLQKNFLNYND